MSVLILHRGPLEASPYHEWLADYEGEVLLLACQAQLDLFAERLPLGHPFYAHLEAFADFDRPGPVEDRALELAARHGVTHLIAVHELVMDRAARLRELLGLPGQGVESVLPFRDKVVMKEQAIAAGVEVAPYTAKVTTALARDFAGEHGFPLVLKPRDGAGSTGLRMIAGEQDLAEVLAELPAEAGAAGDLLLEAYVPGRMCHVDGLVVDGRVVLAWPSQYQYALASFRDDPGGRIDLTLDRDDPLSGRLLELAERMLAHLPTPVDTAFHAEVFHTPDGRLVLCEIACRTGGAQIRQVIRTLFGVDISEYWVRAQLGLPLPALAGGTRLEPRSMAGQWLLMKRPGEVRRVPSGPAPEQDWVEHFQVFVRPGQVMREAEFSSDFLAVAVASAPTRALVEERLRALGEWFEERTEIAAPQPV
ncbi:hypothetical protein [Kitasatospora sp. NBC_00315]|uniref:ATP-binding protein n=1 Tax=Kitasatospora sp. NBC_00315 TaxID=2975963 RepID=UPI0032478D0D